MKPTQCVSLERDRDFKLAYMKRTPYWFNFLFVAPVCFLFLGLVGLLYLLKLDLLLSLYAIPFGVFFVLGTVWMKAVKRHLLKTKVDDPQCFHVCIAVPVGEMDGYSYFVFTNDDKRHNEYHISLLAEELPFDYFPNILKKQARKSAVLVEDEEIDAQVYLKGFPTKDVKRKDAVRDYDDFLPVLAIDEKQVGIISRREYEK